MTLLLSTSPNPPVIFIENQNLRTSTSLKPKASNSRAVVSAFHPARKNIFLIAFADGILAAYDHNKISKGQHIHQFGHLHDAVLSNTGIVAAEFIPGQQLRAVTVGEDGRLFVVDFDQKSVIGSYHVGAPITSLSIRTVNAPGRVGSSQKGEPDWIAAIGTIHGWSYIFDKQGQKIGESLMDEQGGKISSLEWVYGEVKVPPMIGMLSRKKAKTQDPVLPDLPRKTPKKSGKPVPKTTANVSVAPSEKGMIDEDNNKQEGLNGNTHDESILAIPPDSLHEQPINEGVRLSASPVKLDKCRHNEDEREQSELEAQKPVVPAWQEITKPFETDYMSLFSPVKQERRRSARINSASSDPSSSRKRTITESADVIERLVAQAVSNEYHPSISAPQLEDSLLMESPLKKKLKTPKTATTNRATERFSSIPRPGSASPTKIPKMTKGSLQPVTMPVEVPAIISMDTIPHTDTKMLKEIKTLRDRVDRANPAKRPKGGLALFAPFLPNANVMKKLRSNTSFCEKENADDSCADSGIESNSTDKPQEVVIQPTNTQSIVKIDSKQNDPDESFDAWLSDEQPDSKNAHHIKKRKHESQPNDDTEPEVSNNSASNNRSRTTKQTATTSASANRTQPKVRKIVAFHEYKEDSDSTNQTPKHKLPKRRIQATPRVTAAVATAAPLLDQKDTVTDPYTSMTISSSSEITSLSNAIEEAKECTHKDIQALQIEMLKQFQQQRRAFEDILKEERKRNEKMREENKHFREEVMRLLRFREDMGVFAP